MTNDKDAIAEIIYLKSACVSRGEANGLADKIMDYINQHYVRLDKVVEGKYVCTADACIVDDCRKCKTQRPATVLDLIGGE